MKKILCTLVLIIFFSHNSKAQFEINFGGTVGLPVGDFYTNTGGYIAGGFDAGAYYQIGPSELPIWIGLEFGTLILGTKRQKDLMDIRITSLGYTTYIPLELQTIVRSNILDGHFAVRAVLPTGFFIEPFLDGIIGFNYLYTRAKIKDVTSTSDEWTKYYWEHNALTPRTTQDDWSFVYGGALGLKFKIGEAFCFELKTSYLLGTAAEYHNYEAIQNTSVEFQVTGQTNKEGKNIIEPVNKIQEPLCKSYTDMVQVTLGISIVLKNK